MEYERLITSSNLSPAEDLKCGVPRGAHLIIKNVPSQTYLSVDADQWKILERFKEARSVSEVLPELILDRQCPPLRVFYELILKAIRARVLKTEDAAIAPARAADWDGSGRSIFHRASATERAVIC